MHFAYYFLFQEQKYCIKYMKYILKINEKIKLIFNEFFMMFYIENKNNRLYYYCIGSSPLHCIFLCFKLQIF